MAKKTRGISSPRRDVFIVHGIDHEPVKELKGILLELGLNPIVLHEQPSGSRTIIEKLEKYSDVGFAFAILTPDDRGLQGSPPGGFPSGVFPYGIPKSGAEFGTWLATSLKPRARQNVVLEFGYLIGKLGRDKVCCLYKGNVELPSDMQGIVYIQFIQSANECRDQIIAELKAAGYRLKSKQRVNKEKGKGVVSLLGLLFF
jgi:predicted nucleotide-binding protein